MSKSARTPGNALRWSGKPLRGEGRGDHHPRLYTPASARRSPVAVVVSTLTPCRSRVAVFHRGDPANYREEESIYR